MISRLEGLVVHKETGSAIISTGGIGFKVSTTTETLENLHTEKPAKLFTYLAVREDALELYGFLNEETCSFFELLLTVSGIGPKSALTILNSSPVRNLKSAISSGDATHLTKTTSVGMKKAEKIILELRDKIDVLDSELSGHKELSDAIDALHALGYSRREAQEALKNVPRLITSTEGKIKEALKLLGK